VLIYLKISHIHVVIIIGPINPTIVPINKKSLEFIFLLEYTIAFGGVDTDNSIAFDALKATIIIAFFK
jgi:hypothetical protein